LRWLKLILLVHATDISLSPSLPLSLSSGVVYLLNINNHGHVVIDDALRLEHWISSFGFVCSSIVWSLLIKHYTEHAPNDVYDSRDQVMLTTACLVMTAGNIYFNHYSSLNPVVHLLAVTDCLLPPLVTTTELPPAGNMFLRDETVGYFG
jgi:hypothetical protein